ncbi:aminotransferase class I/II [Paenibacillus selenitireducens]|uniref:cysteine-S-conjugate beta-lyase n=1 Tax=Paenibacillus selenitireducens TaxID=1324314 RepID=A0A1T2X369_9BACL|nr:MalY/PatB family protein [Paenibacillus selenitireducens]OPA74302.1 aminotransferase class I/II [Paenibacillus selenitireducens]
MNSFFDQITNRFGTNSDKWEPVGQQFGHHQIALSVADMDLRISPAIQDVVMHMAEHGIYGYTNAYASYYDAVQRWMRDAYQWPIEQDWIVFCPRIVQAVSLIIQHFTQETDRVLIHTPSYFPLQSAVTRNHRTLVESPLLLKDGRYEINFEEMEQHMREGIKILLWVSPQNPTGRVWTRQELERVAALCIKYDVLLVSDDIHADFVHPGHEHTVIARLSDEIAARSIICTSPAKTFNLAGLAVSNIIIPNQQLRDQFKKVLLQTGIFDPTYFAVPALEAAYTKSDVWLEELLLYIQGNIKYAEQFIADHMPELKVIQPEGTYLLWVDCRGISENESVLKQWIEVEAGVTLCFGTAYGAIGEGYVRINLGTPRPLLQQGLERMLAAYPKKSITL